jgi:hypothetical protein
VFERELDTRNDDASVLGVTKAGQPSDRYIEDVVAVCRSP